MGCEGCDSPLEVCCCCRCLLPLGVAKAILMFPFIFLWSETVGVGIGVIHWFRWVPQAYWALMIQQTTTWKLALVAILGATVPMFLYWPGMLIGSVIVAIGFGAVMPVATTLSYRDEGIGPFNITDVLEQTLRFTKKWWELGEEIEREIHRWRDSPLVAGEMPFDLPFYKMFNSILLMVIAFILVVPAWTLIAVIKFFPATVMAFGAGLVEGYDKLRDQDSWKVCCFFPCWILGCLLIPIPCVLFLVVMVLHSVGVCLLVPVIYYREESAMDTLWSAVLMVAEFDRRTTGVLAREFGCCGIRHWSIFEYCDGCQTPQDLKEVVDTLIVWSNNQSPAQLDGNV